MTTTQAGVTYKIHQLESLQLGWQQAVKSYDNSAAASSVGKPWTLPAGVYTPRQIVEANAPLLEIVVHHLGESPSGEPSARDLLVDNLASNLALNTRESSITIPTRDLSRTELAKQAESIGKRLIEYAKAIKNVSYDPNYVIRSPCEGHLWKPPVAQLIFGPRSQRHLAQLYNEYSHQIILLRDALLPFENFEDVLIPIEEKSEQRGLRHTEQTRGAFLTEISTKQVSQRSIVKLAQFLLAPTLPKDNVYAFQYKYGAVLPSFVAGGESPRLLRYVPAVLEKSHEQVAFQYELADYYEAPRINIPAETTAEADDTTLQKISVEPREANKAHTLQLYVQYTDGSSAAIDVGQAARGRRYAFFTQNKQVVDVETGDVQIHSAKDILTKSGTGLIIPAKGLHLIRVSSKVELYAVLGKLYPDNVVIFKQGQSLSDALKTGRKGLPDSGRVIVELNNQMVL
jgi:hypothetical protein